MKDLRGVSLRRAVAHRLDGFFAEWLRHLGDGTARTWPQAEASRGKPGAASPPPGRAQQESAQHETPPQRADDNAAPVMRVPMQQQPQPQPMQQQQQKKNDET